MTTQETKETTSSAQESNQNATATNQGSDITIQDLQSLKAIIDVASQRGAFKPTEMVSVGQTYVKLDNFLTAVIEQQQQNKQQ